MIKLLKIEWLKIKGYTAFLLLTIFFALGVVTTNYIVYVIKTKLIDQVQMSQVLFSDSPFHFNLVWQTVSYYSSFFLMLPALLIVILVTNEYSYKTHRQNIIDGWSRLDFLKVKIILGVLLALGCTLVVILTGLIFGFASGTSFSLHGFQNIGYFFLKALSYNMIALLIALLTKRSGLGVAVFFIYTILENGVSLLLFVAAINLKRDHQLDFGNIGNYLPMNASDGLLTSPLDKFSGMAKGIMPSDFNYIVLAFAFAYLMLFFFWSRKKMLQSDL